MQRSEGSRSAEPRLHADCSASALPTTGSRPAKRGRACLETDDAPWQNRCPFGAVDIALAIQKPLLPDEVLARAVVPVLRGAQRTCGSIPFRVLVSALTDVLTAGTNQHSQYYALQQFAVDRLLFAGDMVHESPDQAAIFCSCLVVDPWNTASQAAACQVGNFNEVPPTLADAVEFFRSKAWDLRHACHTALSTQYSLQNVMTFPHSPGLPWSRSKKPRF